MNFNITNCNEKKIWYLKTNDLDKKWHSSHQNAPSLTRESVSTHSALPNEDFISICNRELPISFAYGTYAVMPIPYRMAPTWFVGTIVGTTLGGLLLGLIIRK